MLEPELKKLILKLWDRFYSNNMANTFKNIGSASIGTSEVSVYTCPSSTTSTIIGLTCANLTTTSPIRCSIRLYDSSATAHYYIVKDAEIFEGGSLVVVGGDQKVVLEAGDIIKVSSNTASSIDCVISYMETT